MTVQKVVDALLEQQGMTYAEEADIELDDKPGPLYQLLVLATLLSTRITADIAVAAARELFAAGYRSPDAMLAATWQDRVDALGRGHYRRYDESTATTLADGACHCDERWHGDLRNLHTEAAGDPRRARDLLTGFPGIGPTGAAIYLREVRAVWSDLGPFVDQKVTDGARLLSLPAEAQKIAALVEPTQLMRLTAALVRVALHPKTAEAILDT